MSSVKGRYSRITIPLDEPETDKELFLAGDYFSIITIVGEGTCEIKLDHRHSQKINLREVTGFTGLFERIFFTTDGSGGSCTFFVGTGMAITISPDPQNIWGGASTSTQATTVTDVVLCLASSSMKLRDVTILNSNGIYACYVGSYHPDPATFKAYAYTLLPHKKLRFSEVDMYSLGAISYDNVNNVVVNIIGTYV